MVNYNDLTTTSPYMMVFIGKSSPKGLRLVNYSSLSRYNGYMTTMNIWTHQNDLMPMTPLDDDGDSGKHPQMELQVGELL